MKYCFLPFASPVLPSSDSLISPCWLRRGHVLVARPQKLYHFTLILLALFIQHFTRVRAAQLYFKARVGGLLNSLRVLLSNPANVATTQWPPHHKTRTASWRIRQSLFLYPIPNFLVVLAFLLPMIELPTKDPSRFGLRHSLLTWEADHRCWRWLSLQK